MAYRNQERSLLQGLRCRRARPALPVSEPSSGDGIKPPSPERRMGDLPGRCLRSPYVGRKALYMLLSAFLFVVIVGIVVAATRSANAEGGISARRALSQRRIPALRP